MSANEGKTWNLATLHPILSISSWVFWEWQWLAPGRDHYTLMVRATDGTGSIQTSDEREAVPDGATGLHAVIVTVGEA